jgi:hypothetical protein
MRRRTLVVHPTQAELFRVGRILSYHAWFAQSGVVPFSLGNTQASGLVLRETARHSLMSLTRCWGVRPCGCCRGFSACRSSRGTDDAPR